MVLFDLLIVLMADWIDEFWLLGIINGLMREVLKMGKGGCLK
jgi:hypothetical protein